VSDRQVRFEDFVLQFDSTARGGFRARVLKSPFGEGAVGFSLPALAGTQPASPGDAGVSRGIESEIGNDVESGLGGEAIGAHHRDIGAAVEAAGVRPPLEIGTDLYRSIFQGQVRSLLDKSRGQLEKSPGLGIRLKIKLDPNDAETSALADLPWELLCDGETEDFFALSRQTSLVRYLDVPRSSQPIPFAPPLRILAVGASPYGLQPLDLGEEERRLQELNRGGSGVEVRFIGHASAGAVREALAGDTYNVLHFMGHGTFDRTSGEGMLAFETAGGSPDLVSGKAFATKLRDLRSLGVVVLNACNTARAGQQGGGNPFSGVAAALVQGGVPAVVAMQRPISDRAAIGFSTAFYRHLASGDSVDEALTEGRQAIHSAKPDSFEWATPVLFLRVPEGNVFVSKPAPPEEEPKPAPAPAVALGPAPGPVAAGRGRTIKIAAGAAGAAGAVVVASILYLKQPSPSGPPAPTTPATSATSADPSLGSQPAPQPQNPQTDGTTTPASKKKSPVNTDTASGNSKVTANKVADPTTPSTSAAPPPIVKPPVNPTGSQAPAETADLSRVSAQMLGISKAPDGALRVKVQFTNNGDLPVFVELDATNSVLNDEKGESNGIIGSNPRFSLAAGASTPRSFDFPAPMHGSKKFSLSLLSAAGAVVPVSGSTLTLPDSP
jgi:hypothetical protein